MKGFTLLFASLVVSILLSIGLTISSITFAQLTLSSSGRESQFAFYNADTGVECALYYEYKGTNGNGGPFFPRNNTDSLTSPITCNGSSVNVSFVGTPTLTSATTTFSINPASAGCLTRTQPSYTVTVAKTASSSGNNNFTSVTVQSRGYNTCDTTSPKRVERGLYANLSD